MAEEITQSNPLLTVLLQGIMEPQYHCRELSGGMNEKNPLNLSAQEHGVEIEGTWQLAMKAHRISVRIEIYKASHRHLLADPQIASYLQVLAADIVRLHLQSQALFSEIKIELNAYTITIVGENGQVEPMWFSESKPPEYPAIEPDDFVKGANLLTVMPDAAYLRALRDFNLALDFKDDNRLIYLWRAIEEILWAHAPTTTNLDSTPPHEPAAKNLLLYRDKTKMGGWINEIAKLAHSYARHALGSGNRPKLPATLDRCIATAQSRTVELIVRHAQYVDGNTGHFLSPANDILTDWLKTP